MKKADENRYPHSADLFKFCKEALNIKHNFEVKVIDQHVGAILGYDPADCSHWKKGKKNIKSLQTITTIAQHLEIDPRFVTDIISGKMDLEESIQEYKGYGAFSVSTRYYDEVKREYFRNPAKFAAQGEARTFEQVIDIQREQARALTAALLAKADVRACPVMTPELAAALPDVAFRAAQLGAGVSAERLVTTTVEHGRFVITARAGEMRPHLRYLIAREIGRVTLFPGLAAQVPASAAPGASPAAGGLEGDGDELTSARINMFANHLLIPGELLQKATRQVDHTRDLVEQLSEVFWVSRTIMNARLKDFFAHGN